MSYRSIRFRLTAWYLLILAVGLSVFGVGSWFAMRESVFHTIDEELGDRVRGILKFMQAQISSLSPVEIRDEFREHSVLGPGGDLFQVCTDTGEWLYRSAVLENNEVPILRPDQLGDHADWESGKQRDLNPYRHKWQELCPHRSESGRRRVGIGNACLRRVDPRPRGNQCVRYRAGSGSDRQNGPHRRHI